MRTRELIINKFNLDVVGGVETVVQNYVRYSKEIPGNFVWVASPDGDHKQVRIMRSSEPGVGVISFPSNFKFAGHHFSILFLMFLLFRSSKFSLVHHQSPFPLGALGMLLSVTMKKRVITYHAPILNKGILGSVLNFIEYLNMLRGHAVIYTSARLFRNYYVKIRDSEILPLSSGAEVAHAEPTEKPSTGLARPFLLYIGRIAPYKGIPSIIDAFQKSKLSATHDLMIVGAVDGRVKIDADSLPDTIHFHPEFVSEAEKERLIKDCFFGILASVDEGEAFGITQLEFMANAKPVLNTVLKTGVSEVSLNGLTGVSCEPKNAHALRSAFDEISDLSECSYKKLCTNAFNRYNTVYRDGKINQKYQQILVRWLNDTTFDTGLERQRQMTIANEPRHTKKRALSFYTK